MYWQPTILVGLIISLILWGCKTPSYDADLSKQYVKVLDDADASTSYTIVDAIELSSGSILLLAQKNLTEVYIAQTNASGELEWDSTLPSSQYIYPIPNIFSIGTNQYFACMDATDNSTHIFHVETDASTGSNLHLHTSFASITYPLAINTYNGSPVISSYDPGSWSSVVSMLNGTVTSTVWQAGYTALSDVTSTVNDHIAQTKPLPFFVFENNNTLAVNGFYNYTLSTLFLNPTDGTLLGSLNTNSPNYTGAISSFMQSNVNSNTYHFSYYQGSNQYYSSAIIDPTTTTSVFDLETNDSMLIKAVQQTVDTLKMPILSALNNQNILFGSSLLNGRIALSWFSENTLTFHKEYFVGERLNYQLGKAFQLSNGDLMITGNVWLEDSYSKLFVMKVPASDL